MVFSWVYGMNDSLHQLNYDHTLVLLKNDQNLIPLKNLSNQSIASIDLSNSHHSSFHHNCNKYTSVNHYSFNTFSSKRMIRAMSKEVKDYEVVILIADTLHEEMNGLFELLSQEKNIILSYLGDEKFDHFDIISHYFSAIIYSPNKSSKEYDLTSQIIFGGYPAQNTLSKNLNDTLKKGFGLTTEKIRLSYGKPKDLDIKEAKLLEIDSIVSHAINEKAMPGCQVLAAKDGHVFLHKSYGNHTYDSSAKRVVNNDIYDLASITKIASSALSLMQLESKGEFSVDSTLGYYLPEMLDSSTYKDLVIKDILTHQAGLASWIPFFLNTIVEGKPSYELYSKFPSSIHENRVAEDLYVLSSYRDSIFQSILSAKLKKKKKYKYSDLGYYFLNEIISKITEENQNNYVEKIYKQLGLNNIGYNPRTKWDVSRIPPTENDTLFRHQLIHGDVHDQGAALLGGVGGHAGLFSNSNDLAVIMQLYLNKGIYGGDTLIEPAIIDKYTSAPYYESNDNRRGIAFDKPVRDGAGGPTCFECMSLSSFGHSGFTGNLTWADPESGILYVFLSNRVYPDAENHKLISMNVRTEVMQVITDALDIKFPLPTQ